LMVHQRTPREFHRLGREEETFLGGDDWQIVEVFFYERGDAATTSKKREGHVNLGKGLPGRRSELKKMTISAEKLPLLHLL